MDSYDLRKVVGGGRPVVIGDVLEQAGNAAQLELLQLVARVAHRIVAGAANSGRDVVNVDCAIRDEEKADALAGLQSAPLEESG